MKTPARILADFQTTMEHLNHLDILMAVTLEAVVARVNGQPGAANLDSAGSGKGGHGDPVANAAIDRDDARTDLAQIEKDVNTLLMIEGRLLRIANAYKPRDGNALERLRSELDKWPICVSCARITIKGQPWKNAAKTRKPATVTVGDKAQDLHLCRWCLDRTTKFNRLPSPSELDAYQRGKRIFDPAA